jgi:hypothetical protein
MMRTQKLRPAKSVEKSDLNLDLPLVVEVVKSYYRVQILLNEQLYSYSCRMNPFYVGIRYSKVKTLTWSTLKTMSAHSAAWLAS